MNFSSYNGTEKTAAPVESAGVGIVTARHCAGMGISGHTSPIYSGMDPEAYVAAAEGVMNASSDGTVSAAEADWM